MLAHESLVLRTFDGNRDRREAAGVDNRRDDGRCLPRPASRGTLAIYAALYGISGLATSGPSVTHILVV